MKRLHYSISVIIKRFGFAALFCACMMFAAIFSGHTSLSDSHDPPDCFFSRKNTAGRRMSNMSRSRISALKAGAHGEQPLCAAKQSAVDSIYASYFGGEGDEGTCALAIDSQGCMYIAGNTRSSDLPGVKTLQDSLHGYQDCYILKLSPDGKRILYSTYLGGEASENIDAIKVDAEGNLYIAGYTTSNDFPVTSNAYKKSFGGDQDCFIAKIDSSGTKLLFSTYLGGGMYEDLFDMTIDGGGNVYIVGLTDSRGSFPRTPDAAQKNYGGGEDDMFLTILKADGSGLLYSTFFGGDDYDEAYSICLGGDGKIYVCGLTVSTNFPVTPDAMQKQSKGYDEGFVVIFEDGGKRVSYSTYITGSLYESCERIKAVGNNTIYLTGYTTSRDFVTTPGVFQPSKSEDIDPNDYSGDSFIMKFSPHSNTIHFSTYLGGYRDDEIRSFFINEAKDVIIGGSTTSWNFPVTPNALKKSRSGYFNIFFAVIDSDASSLLFSSYFGGNEDDGLFALSLTKENELACVGYTTSADFPATSDALQPMLGGGCDAYILILPLNRLLTGISDNYASQTRTPVLHQNYPNPFGNAGTTIPFENAHCGAVSLSIYDASGRRIGEKRWERLEPGGSSHFFNAATLPPGVYFYTLQTGAERITKKMVKIE